MGQLGPPETSLCTFSLNIKLAFANIISFAKISRCRTQDQMLVESS
jgi:hypothetical protein